MQVESMFTATKHQHFRIISILRAETTTVYLNSEEGESCVCDLAGDWPHFKRYAASFMQAHEHLEEAAATRSRRCPRQPARKPRLRTRLAAPLRRRRLQKKKKERNLSRLLRQRSRPLSGNRASHDEGIVRVSSGRVKCSRVLMQRRGAENN